MSIFRCASLLDRNAGRRARRAACSGLAWILAASASLHAAEPVTFDGAKWIWYSREPMPISQNFPGGPVYLRSTFTLPEAAKVRSAELIMTADNLFLLYLNGKAAGESESDPDAWSRPKRFDVRGLLQPGRNVLAVEGINTADGPAALLAKLVVELEDGSKLSFASSGEWKVCDNKPAKWTEASFDDVKWPNAHVVCDYGKGPWGQVQARKEIERAGEPTDAARKGVRKQIEALRQAAQNGGYAGPAAVAEETTSKDYAWPEAVLFVGDDCSLYRPASHSGTSYDSLTVTIFNPNHTRAFPEHDLPAPIKVGRKLMVLKPAQPGVQPRVFFDAGEGGLGSPRVSFDGRRIYFSMARAGEPFFHIYRLPVEGGEAQRLTDGPFHDIDPCELPDGRIVFASTRIGFFDEYHNPPARALHIMDADGRNIRALTHTFVFDNEPQVLADGRIVFIRSDNFFDRGKVETLLHAIHPDGTTGYTEFGLDLAPEYGSRLRAFNCGSPAPLPDGRVAYVTGNSIAIGRPGSSGRDIRQFGIAAGDVAALPDGRLLCTLARPGKVEAMVGKQKKVVQNFSFEKLVLVDSNSGRVVPLFESSAGPIHSPVFLGARTKPPILPDAVNRNQDSGGNATGIMYCQNARHTQNSTAGWSHVRAIRVLGGRGLTTRSSHSYIVHAGSEVVELGTVPLAPDGSFAVEVPADMAIAFQAVDAEGRSELNEMSWIFVRPGEQRGCIGCHSPRQSAPPCAPSRMQAMSTPPLKLLGQGRPHRFRGNNAAVTGMMELQFDRFREVAGIDRHSATADPAATGRQDVEALMAQLRGGKDDLKISAAQRLALFRDRTAAPALVEQLAGGNREARVAAALALAVCGTRESVPALLTALNDTDPLVGQSASIALENLTGHVQAFDAFAERAVRARQSQAWLAWFNETTWERSEQDLVDRIAKGDRDAIRRAAVALGHTGAAAARPALRTYLARERENNPYPEWRKHHNGDGARFNSREMVNPRTLQEVTRALGYLRDAEAVPLLAETLNQHADPDRGNLFLAEAAAEALGRIGTPEAQTALIDAFAKLKDYPRHTSWYGDHGALMACHASPVHSFIIEALDANGAAQAASLATHLIRSVPTDPDRALLLENDDYETLTGRVLRRCGQEAAVVETCLAILGDAQAKRNEEIAKALSAVHGAWAGRPDPENRAAQILSLVCRDRAYESRIRAAFERYRSRSVDILRVFDTGIPVVNKLPVKHWVSFFLARTLGNLTDPASAEALMAALGQSPNEAATGRPDPLGPGVLFLHNDLTPCWRAAVAWALGRIGDVRATPTLLKTVAELENAPDVRHAAAEALGRIGNPSSLEALRKLGEDYPEYSTRRALQRAADGVARRN